jgi:hypothetical protein
MINVDPYLLAADEPIEARRNDREAERNMIVEAYRFVV